MILDATYSTCIGIIIIIFILCVALVIFAPKSIGFFNIDDYGEFGKLSKETDLFLDTSIRLHIADSENIDNTTYEKITELKKDIPFHEIKWKDWPCADQVKNGVKILPIFGFNRINRNNLSIFSKLIDRINIIPDIKAVYFIKLPPNSKFVEHIGFAETNNKTLQFMYCFNSYCYDETECGIWVDRDSKKAVHDGTYIIDSSKSHSIYNNTHDDVIYLIIHFKRPDNIPEGYSTNRITKEIKSQFKKIFE